MSTLLGVYLGHLSKVFHLVNVYYGRIIDSSPMYLSLSSLGAWYFLISQLLHDPNHCPPPPSRGESQGPGWYRENRDRQGFGKGSRDVRHCHQLLRRLGF